MDAGFLYTPGRLTIVLYPSRALRTIVSVGRVLLKPLIGVWLVDIWGSRLIKAQLNYRLLVATEWGFLLTCTRLSGVGCVGVLGIMYGLVGVAEALFYNVVETVLFGWYKICYLCLSG